MIGIRRPGRVGSAAAIGLLTAGVFTLVVDSPASAASTVTVDGATKYQTIDGFGVSEAFGQANSIRNAPSATRQQALDLLFNTSSGAGFSILRSLIPSDSGSIEPNRPSSPSATPSYVWSGNDAQDQGQLWLAKQAKSSYGVKTFYNDAWSAPGYMKTNGSESNGGSLCGTPGASCSSGDWRQAYANYLVQHAKYWSAAGVTPYAVGFVNEPTLTTSYSSMLVNSSQAASFLSVFGPAMSASGLSTKVACCDTLGFNLLPAYVSAAGSSAAGLWTSHGYSNGPSSPVSAGGRSVWESEWGVNGSTWTNVWDTTGEASGITWAQRLHTAMTGANLQAFLYWWGVSSTNHDSSLIGLNGSTLTPSKRYYAMANYSRYIRPGAVRIGASSPDGNLKTSAYRNADGSVVIVALNTASSSTSTSFAVSNTGLSNGTVAAYVTNGSASMSAQSTVGLAAGSFSATVPARSLVTYRITGSGGSSTPPPTTTTSQPPTTSTPPTTTTPPPPTTSTTPPPTSPSGGPTPKGCSAGYSVASAWNGGFTADVTVTAGSGAISGWRVTLNLPGGTTLTGIWNGVNTGTSGAVTVTNQSYNGALGAGASTSFGFQGTGSGSGATVSCSTA